MKQHEYTPLDEVGILRPKNAVFHTLSDNISPFHVLEILYSTPIGALLGFSLLSPFIFIVMKGDHGQPLIAVGYKI